MKKGTKKCRANEKRAEQLEHPKPKSNSSLNFEPGDAISRQSVRPSSANFKRRRNWIELLSSSFSSSENAQISEISCFDRLRFSYISTDPEAEDIETERYMWLTDDFSEEEGAAGGDLKLSTSRSVPSSEIDEFFAQAEKCEARRFAEKYNYDIEKDVPFEGRYEWIPLKPPPMKK